MNRDARRFNRLSRELNDAALLENKKELARKRLRKSAELKQAILVGEGTEFKLPKDTLTVDVTAQEVDGDEMSALLKEFTEMLAEFDGKVEQRRFIDIAPEDPSAYTFLYPVMKADSTEKDEVVQPSAVIAPNNTSEEVRLKLRELLPQVPFVDRQNHLLDSVGAHERAMSHRRMKLGSDTVSRAARPTTAAQTELRAEQGSDNALSFYDQEGTAVRPKVVEGPTVITSPDGKFEVHTQDGARVIRAKTVHFDGDFHAGG